MEQASGARQIVFDVIDQMNHEFTEEEALDKSPSMVLFGPGGRLDSLGLVDLVMRIQEAILDEYDVAVAVANEQVLSSDESPLRTVESLIQHVEGLLANV